MLKNPSLLPENLGSIKLGRNIFPRALDLSNSNDPKAKKTKNRAIAR